MKAYFFIKNGLFPWNYNFAVLKYEFNKQDNIWLFFLCYILLFVNETLLFYVMTAIYNEELAFSDHKNNL